MDGELSRQQSELFRLLESEREGGVEERYLLPGYGHSFLQRYRFVIRERESRETDLVPFSGSCKESDDKGRFQPAHGDLAHSHKLRHFSSLSFSIALIPYSLYV